MNTFISAYNLQYIIQYNPSVKHVLRDHHLLLNYGLSRQVVS